MLKGIHLTLMVGPAAPKAAPYEVVEALTSVEVRINTKQASAFQLQFQLGKQAKLDETFLLSAAAPIMRVVVIATVNGRPNVLIDGVMTNHQVAPNSKSQSTLTVTGEDLTALMDLQDLSGIPYPALPPFARVAIVLAKYAPLGVFPKVIPNIGSFSPNPLDKIPRHKGTDLAYVRELAKTAGYEFYHEPTSAPGRSFAYWGPTIKRGQPQPALTANMDAHDNVETLSFSYDIHKRGIPIAMIQEPFSKVPIPLPIPDVTPLNPALGAVRPTPSRVDLMRDTAKLSFAEGIEKALAAASESANAVSGSGTLDVLRYGRVLEPRKLVAVRGADTAFNGVYYVESVTHKIKRGEYKQDFQLSRNALVSQSQRAPV